MGHGLREYAMAALTCIVCGKSFEQDDARDFRQNFDGKWYRFDDMGCRNRFLGNPQKFVNPQ